jgi:hypothetical protein
MNDQDTVTLFNDDGSNIAMMSQHSNAAWTSTNPKVTYNGFGGFVPQITSGNIKVSNPGSNVAPEPGSIALLLTGGGALAGIALRRRRNAA